LRKQVFWDGWHVSIPGLEGIGESTTRAVLEDLMQAAAGKAIETFEAIAAGRIAPRPADRNKCKWCDFRDACRVEAAAETHEAGAGSA
jgi:ATP-dependent helicase/DNAse subunit B